MPADEPTAQASEDEASEIPRDTGQDDASEAQTAHPAPDRDTPGREAEDVARFDLVRRERDEYLDLARRAKADFENYRKRSAQQVSEAARRGKAEIVRELLPSIDSLERALESASADSDGLAHGVGLVRDGLIATLERAGVEVFDPVGESFDPSWHEALSTRPADGSDAGTVVETLDRGYRIDGQLLRPARVVVCE